MPNPRKDGFQLKQVRLYIITLVVLTTLPAATSAQQGTALPNSPRTAAQKRRDKLADDLIRATSAAERERLLAQNKKLLTAALVDDLIERGMSFREQEYDEEALALFQSAQKIAEQIHYTRGVINAIWHVGYLYKLQENYDAAIKQATQALTIAKQSKDEHQHAQSLRLLGDIYLQRGNVPAGLDNLQQSMSIGERLRHQHVVAWSANSLAYSYKWQGNDAEAVRYFRKAVQAFDLLPDEGYATRARYDLADAYHRLTNYREALKLYETILPLLKKPDTEEAQAELLLEIFNCYFQLKDRSGTKKTVAQVVKLIEDLFAKAKQEKALRIAVKINHQQGNALYQMAEYPNALKAYQEALKRAEQIKDTDLLNQALKSIGDVHLAQGKPDLADEFYQRSLGLIPTDAKWRASVLFQIGKSYSTRDHLSEALKYFKEGLIAATNDDNKELMADVRSALAGLYLLQGKTQQALGELEECRKLYGELGIQHQVILTMNKIGILHTWGNDFRSAARILNEALNQAGEVRDVEAIAIVHSALADTKMVQGDDEAAITHLQASLRAYTKIQNNWGMANVQFSLGRLYVNQNKLGDAVKVVQEGMNASWEAYDVVNKIKIKLFLGQAFMRQNNYDAALKAFQDCHELAVKENIPLMAGLSQMLIGSTYYAQKEYPKALTAIEKAAPIITQTNNQLLNGFMRSLAGFVYQALGRDDEALEAILEGITAMEKARTNVAGLEQEQMMFFAQGQSIYHMMIQLLVKRNNVAEALFWADRSKARVLLDIMQRGAVDLEGAMSQEERSRKVVLESRLAALNVQLLQENQSGLQNHARSMAISGRVQAARQELQEFLTNFYITHPELRRRIGHVSPMRVEEAAALLPDAESALLEYVVTDEEIFLFVLTREAETAAENDKAPSWKVYRIEISDALLLKIIYFRRAVSGGDIGFKPAARELYDLLLKPAQAQLQGKNSLIIVPDGMLWNVPFQALQTPAKHYLLEDYTISYAPSLATLREMRHIHDGRHAAPRPQASTQAMLFALGNPSGIVPPLPETEEEVNRLENIYGKERSKVFVETEATEERFKDWAGLYRIVHLATHGLLDDSKPMYSQIVLAQLNKRSQTKPPAPTPDGTAPTSAPENDGLLEARELIGLKLNADLVVLSACETARGKISHGEGLIGLTWVLFAAGTPTTVASQWKVDSRSTTELMLAFHEALKPGMLATNSEPGTAKALRQAALKLIRQERYRHPFYWAGFVVVGDGR